MYKRLPQGVPPLFAAIPLIAYLGVGVRETAPMLTKIFFIVDGFILGAGLVVLLFHYMPKQNLGKSLAVACMLILSVAFSYLMADLLTQG